MTVQQPSMKQSDERWAADYMAKERRRNITLGIAVVIGVALSVLAVLYYFGSFATTGW